MALSHLTFDELSLELANSQETCAAIRAEMKARADEELAKLEARKQTIMDLIGAKNTPDRPAKNERKKKGKRQAGEVKYQYPSDPKKSWTGRGWKPKWVVEWMAAGNPIESLEVAKPFDATQAQPAESLIEQ